MRWVVSSELVRDQVLSVGHQVPAPKAAPTAGRRLREWRNTLYSHTTRLRTPAAHTRTEKRKRATADAPCQADTQRKWLSVFSPCSGLKGFSYANYTLIQSQQHAWHTRNTDFGVTLTSRAQLPGFIAVGAKNSCG